MSFRLIQAGILYLFCFNIYALDPPSIYFKNLRNERLEEEARYYASRLELNAQVAIRINLTLRLPEGILGLIQYERDSVYIPENQFIIWLNSRASFSEQSTSLAHEMIHVKQYLDGRLSEIDDKTLQWEGEEFRNFQRIPHDMRPWESEAIELGLQMRRDYLREGRFQEVML